MNHHAFEYLFVNCGKFICKTLATIQNERRESGERDKVKKTATQTVFIRMKTFGKTKFNISMNWDAKTINS